MCRTLVISDLPTLTRRRQTKIQRHRTKMFSRGGSSYRGGHSGAGNGSDKDRKAQKRPAEPDRVRRPVRKRGAFQRWFNSPCSATPPASPAAHVPCYEHGSSSGPASSRMAAREPQLPKREEEQKQQDRPPRHGLLPGDFTADEDLDWIIEEMIQHSKQQQKGDEERRQQWEELNELRIQMAIDASLHPVIELSSDSDSEFDWDD